MFKHGGTNGHTPYQAIQAARNLCAPNAGLVALETSWGQREASASDGCAMCCVLMRPGHGSRRLQSITFQIQREASEAC